MLNVQDINAAWQGGAFMIGNGYMGAMVSGDARGEVLELWEHTFEGGGLPVGRLSIKRNDGKLGAGEYKEDGGVEGAGEYKEDGEVEGTGEYKEDGGVADAGEYRSGLDMENGIAMSEYVCGKTRVSSKAFASHEQKMLVYETVSEGQDMELLFSFLPGDESEYVRYQIGGIFFVCESEKKMWTTGGKSSLLCGKVSLYTDGFPQAKADGLLVRRASRAAVYITLITDDGEETLPKERQILQLQMRMNRDLIKTESIPFDQILDAHKGDMSRLYASSDISIEGRPDVEEMYRMGRYLLYSSHRGKLPESLRFGFEDPGMPFGLNDWSGEIAETRKMYRSVGTGGLFRYLFQMREISHMLMQSTLREIRILPGIPEKWTMGHITGLMAEGGVEVDITWENRSVMVWMTARNNTRRRIMLGDQQKTVLLIAGERKLV